MLKKFPIGDVLSVSTGLSVSERGLDGFWELMNYLTGESLMTHQLPRAHPPCQRWVLESLPQLQQVKVPSEDDRKDWTPDDWKDWVHTLSVIYGLELELSPMPEGYYEAMNPLAEPILQDKKVIAVAVDDIDKPTIEDLTSALHTVNSLAVFGEDTVVLKKIDYEWLIDILWRFEGRK